MKYTLKHCTVLDGRETMKPEENRTIWIGDGKIIRISAEETVQPESTVIDMQGMYVMPGLINMHAHLAASGKPPRSDKKVDYKGLADKLLSNKAVQKLFLHLEKGYVKQELYSGVTTVRTMGGLLDLDGQIRDMINEDKIVGPRILSADTAVSVPGGHFAGSLATEAKSAEEAAADVRRMAENGADLIKLMITGGVMDASAEGEPGALRMPAEYVRAACAEAHHYGLKVAAHVESPEGVRVALANGVDTIEHGAQPDEEILRLFRERNAADICTLSPALPYALFALEESHAGEIGQKNGRIVFEGIIACAKACLAAGIPVGMGTDTGCPFITHYNMWREVCYFQKYLEVEPSFALYTATLGNARIAGIDSYTGSVEAGKSADLIVAEKDPLEDLRALKELKYVFIKGKMIRDPKVKRMPEVEKLLDRYM